jgi:hypothetical protein
MKHLKHFLAVLFLAVFVTIPAAAGALTNFAENKIADAMLRGQALGAPATWYIGLDTVACGEDGSGTEVTGGSYARASVSASLAAWAGTQSAGSTTASSGTNGTTSNNGTITFATPSASWGTVVSLRLWDAASSGNAWICTTLGLSKTINSGDSVTFPAGAFTIQIDN